MPPRCPIYNGLQSGPVPVSQPKEADVKVATGLVAVVVFVAKAVVIADPRLVRSVYPLLLK